MDTLKNKTKFSGSTPPEIFIGRHGYPDINAGILSPIKYGNTENFSSPEIWFKKSISISEISEYRNQLLYARFKANIKKESQLKKILDQVALAKNSVSAEFFLKKPVKFIPVKDSSVPFIGNLAPVEKIILEENPKIERKIDYISSDNSLKATEGIKELYRSKIQLSNIIKILSAGLLGIKNQRKMVPTRWAITATDDTLSKEMLKEIRFFQEINDFQVFTGEYLGNHYEILLLPDKYAFEVIEIAESNPCKHWHDYEFFYGRKNYASSVTGAYYANRLALCEYLKKIKRQATAIFFREIRPEYSTPLGVGILREVTRNAFIKNPEKFQTLKEALTQIQTGIKTNIEFYTSKSILLKTFGKQKKLSQWF